MEYIIDDLQMGLKHEAFDKFLHIFLFNCQEAEMEEDLQKQLENIELLKVLIRGKEFKIDEMDNINQSTPL